MAPAFSIALFLWERKVGMREKIGQVIAASILAIAFNFVIWTVPAVYAVENGKLPTRAEIAAGDKWRLEDIYADETLWQADFRKAKDLVGKLASYRGKLGGSSRDLLDCLKLRDQISLLTGERLYAYARLRQDEDTTNNAYQALTGQAQALLTEASAASAYIEPEILAIPDERLAQFRRQEKGFADYDVYFERLSRQKKHILPPGEEEILSKVSEVTDTPAEVFEIFTNADLRYPSINDETGVKVELSPGRYGQFIKSQDRRVRQEAFQGFNKTYSQYRNTLALTLNNHVKKNIFYARVRGYKSALEAALDPNQIPVAVYDNLIQTVNGHLAPLHRYVALKKKLLGLQEIHMYDLYTPLVQDSSLDLSYPDGVQLVESALAPLGEEYAAALNKGLTSGWVDVHESKGKRSGAYSWGIYGIHPFVLLNYNNQLSEVSTIAHEMGHALHSYYSNRTQPYPKADYAIFTAETASTTNEALLINYLLEHTSDKNQKLYLLNQYLEDIRTTIYRQTLFAEFEKLIYYKAEQGEILTADLLEKNWNELNVKYFGPEMNVDPEIDIEWARIPHFYRSFYVYQYATGYAAALAFADQLTAEGQAARNRYINYFLKAGGSDAPIQILKRAGVDMSSPRPVETALEKFDSLLTQMEQLMAEK